MLKLNELSKIVKKYGLQVESTGRGKHPFKVKGIVLCTNRQHTYPLRIHGKNPEISKSYLKVILARLTDMLKNSDESIGYSTPNSVVNHLFYRVFSIETILINKTNLPFGASIVAVCRKT
ncbi:MAG: hypothetical protein JRI62_06635 [Deltaproteobacteria bacterium]|nr:hypothetical protein [Deltaproteobacteria bacterium]